jgi:hypothetical protein
MMMYDDQDDDNYHHHYYNSDDDSCYDDMIMPQTGRPDRDEGEGSGARPVPAVS